MKIVSEFPAPPVLLFFSVKEDLETEPLLKTNISKRGSLSSNVPARRTTCTENVLITELSSPNQRSEQRLVFQHYRVVIVLTNR